MDQSSLWMLVWLACCERSVSGSNHTVNVLRTQHCLSQILVRWLLVTHFEPFTGERRLLFTQQVGINGTLWWRHCIADGAGSVWFEPSAVRLWRAVSARRVMDGRWPRHVLLSLYNHTIVLQFLWKSAQNINNIFCATKRKPGGDKSLEEHKKGQKQV